MNTYLNPLDCVPGLFDPTADPDMLVPHLMRKTSDMINPPPFNVWVIMDEAPRSIDSGSFLVGPPSYSSWFDYPATYHNLANEIAFADGHVETKRWNDPALHNVVTGLLLQPSTGPDLAWLQERTYQKKRLDEASR